jgi:hypothetical protein
VDRAVFEVVELKRFSVLCGQKGLRHRQRRRAELIEEKLFLGYILFFSH